jgi:methionyl-tRNA synthetase
MIVNVQMEKYIVTSALPYINGVKHLGNLIGSLLSADVYARFLRQQGHKVLFVCGTDEHGAPAELAAAAANQDPQRYCDNMHEIQADIYRRFDLSFDHFGRTSSQSNHQVTQQIFSALYEKGYIGEATTDQYYDTIAERFLPDRYIVGTCPYCKSTAARGDQCDDCGKLLDPLNLIDPRSAINPDARLEVRTSRHLFLQLPKLEALLKPWIKESSSEWSQTAISIANSWLAEGLRDRCISRDLTWGIPIPLPGFEDKRFYVWFDAPNGYISISIDWCKGDDRWKEFWKDPNTKLVHFLAKDNVPFHTIIWPSMLLGADLGFTLPFAVKAFQYLNYEGSKFSTSNRRGIFTDQALDELPSDYWRNYLVSIAPESADSQFTWEGLRDSTNVLADTLGNFVNRVVAFAHRAFGGSMERPRSYSANAEHFVGTAADLARTATLALNGRNYREWHSAMHRLWIAGNQFLESTSPWKSVKIDKHRAAGDLYVATAYAHYLAIVSAPLLPNFSSQIVKLLGVSESSLLSHTPFQELILANERYSLQQPTHPLVNKITDDQVLAWQTKYAGI